MKLIHKTPYSEVQFKYIEDHYDLHLKGTCYYNRKLHLFVTEPDFSQIDKEDIDYPVVCKIYRLNFWEKLKWLYKQKVFETCIGYHYSYDENGNKGSNFYLRKPQWLYQILFKVYYDYHFMKSE